MRCTGKEQLTCNEEKMGCEGCYYNDEFKVGEYARTDNGLIIKVDFIDYNDLCVGSKGVTYNFEDIEEMNNFIKTVKHRSNIIDLVKVGDYVNGKKIIKTYLEGARHYIKYEYYDGTRIYNEDIKNIVTKEQFSSVEYRLEK